jgi:hypothetical protein
VAFHFLIGSEQKTDIAEMNAEVMVLENAQQEQCQLTLKIQTVTGPCDTTLPCCIKEGCNDALVHDEIILDTVLQVHKVIKSGSVVSKSATGIQKEIYAF